MLSRAEAARVLGHLSGDALLLASLMYGSGLRLNRPWSRSFGRTWTRSFTSTRTTCGQLPQNSTRWRSTSAREWPWQWVFPAPRTYTDAETGQIRRHHLYPTTLQRAVKRAMVAARLHKHASCHSLRHSFATHLLEGGCDVGRLQLLLGPDRVSAVRPNGIGRRLLDRWIGHQGGLV